MPAVPVGLARAGLAEPAPADQSLESRACRARAACTVRAFACSARAACTVNACRARACRTRARRTSVQSQCGLH
eukprot:2064220-Heterocapsa_arctica.AAC.1